MFVKIHFNMLLILLFCTICSAEEIIYIDYSAYPKFGSKLIGSGFGFDLRDRKYSVGHVIYDIEECESYGLSNCIRISGGIEFLIPDSFKCDESFLNNMKEYSVKPMSLKIVGESYAVCAISFPAKNHDNFNYFYNNQRGIIAISFSDEESIYVPNIFLVVGSKCGLFADKDCFDMK